MTVSPRDQFRKVEKKDFKLIITQLELEKLSSTRKKINSRKLIKNTNF